MSSILSILRTSSSTSSDLQDAVTINNITGGSYHVSLSLVKSLIEKHGEQDPILCLTTVIKSTPTKYIHPIIDVDYRHKKIPEASVTHSERKLKAMLMVRYLNDSKVFRNATNWDYSLRDNDKSGIHLYHRHLKLKKEEYPKLVKAVSDIVSDNDWQVDCPTSITLPYCGKESHSSFVYKNSIGQPDPWLWCDCTDCEHLSIEYYDAEAGSSGSSGGGGDNVANVAQERTLKEIFQEAKNDYMELLEQCLPHECNNENALYFHALCPNIAELETCDDEQAQCILSAKNVQLCLGESCRKDCMDACIATVLNTDTKDITRLHQDGRGIKISEIFFDHFRKAMLNGNMSLVKLLLALQFPVYKDNDGNVYVYTLDGWRREPAQYIVLALKDVIRMASEQCDAVQCTLSKKGEKRKRKTWITLKNNEIRDHLLTYWNLENKMSRQKGLATYRYNKLVCSSDYYLFAKGSTRWIKSTVLHPFFMKHTLNFDLERLQNGMSVYETEMPLALRAMERCRDVQNGLASFLDIFDGDANFLLKPILSCTYFLITFFNFDADRIKYFIKIMHGILFGTTKRIILMVGPSANNGKTTLAKIVNVAFGKTCGAFNQAELMRNTSQTSPDFVENANKKITFLDECGGQDVDINSLKRLTSGGIASHRTLFQKNETLTCTTNFIMYGNGRPTITIDEGIRKRTLCFDVTSIFNPSVISDTYAHLKLKVKYDPQQPSFSSLDIDEVTMGYGLLIMLLYLKNEDVVLQNEDYVVKQLAVDNTLDAFIVKHLQKEEGRLIKLSEVLEKLRTYASEQDANANVLEQAFLKKFHSYLRKDKLRNYTLI